MKKYSCCTIVVVFIFFFVASIAHTLGTETDERQESSGEHQRVQREQAGTPSVPVRYFRIFSFLALSKTQQ